MPNVTAPIAAPFTNGTADILTVDLYSCIFLPFDARSSCALDRGFAFQTGMRQPRDTGFCILAGEQ